MASADRLIAVFTEAKARPAGPERDRFLAEACGEDTELKGHVLSLLEADSEEGRTNFLKNTIAIPVARITEKPGDRIGRYKLLQQLGEGGCGVVYMAEQEEPVRRRVALKVIKLGMDTKSVIARFEAERQALALMDHPNIAKVFDAGSTERPLTPSLSPSGGEGARRAGEGDAAPSALSAGRPFFVMELVRGIKITDYCDQNNLTTDQRLELFTQVCHAVQHAHQKGIIHRDLKPSNILVTLHDGVPVPKVIDFGVAKATSDQRLTDKTIFTAFEQFIGTPAYMSPEQAEMSGLDIDTRSDIYSLGVLLFELLTGKTPLDPEELLRSGMNEMRRKIREEEPPRPSTRLSTMQAADLTTIAKHRQADAPKLVHLVHGDLDWIVMKCLEKDRTRRYETANGLAADVNRHLNNEPIVARPPSGFYRFQKLVQRNWLTFAASAAVVVATLMALVILVASNVRITRESKAKVAALNAAKASEQRAKDQLFTSLRSQAQARRYSRQMGQRLDSLAAVTEASRIRHDPSLADDAVAAMALADVRLGPVRKSGRTNSVVLAFDALFERCAFLDDNGSIIVRSVVDNRELQRLKVSAPDGSDPLDHFLSLSPDGRMLGYVRDGSRPYVWRVGDAQEILHDPPRNCSQVVFSPDSHQLIMNDGKWILSFDPVTGRERRRWQANDTVLVLAFGPDNRRFAASYVKEVPVSVFDVFTADKLFDLAVGPDMGFVLGWHPDGQRLAMGGPGPNIQIWNLERRCKVATLPGHAQLITDLVFHPGGELLASASWDGTVRLWETASGRQIMQLPINGALQCGADARWFGVIPPARDQVQLLEITPPREYRTIVGSLDAIQAEYHSCAVSPNNQLLAVGMGDGVRLWNPSSHREVAFLEVGKTLSVAFTADTRALLTCGKNGVKRWPIKLDGAEAAEWSIGPPQTFRLPFRPQRLALNRDGRTVGVMNEAAGQVAVLDLETAGVRGQLMTHAEVSFIALSPDAHWLATSGWHSDRARLWDAQTCKLTWEKVLVPPSMVFFTPDNRELVISTGGEFTFFDLNTLEVSRRLPRDAGLFPGDIAFTADGKLMAMEMSPAVIHLKEVATGRTIAKLEDPFGDRSNWMAFTPDSDKLFVVATYNNAVHIWDLRAIRTRLKPMGLDWDWREFPPATQPEVTHGPSARPALKVRVLSAEGG